MISDKIKELLAKHSDWFKSHNVKLSIEEQTEIKMAATSRALDGSEIGTPTEFIKDAELYVIIEGQPSVAPDGEIAMEDGTTIVVKDGKIAEIREKVEEMSDNTALVIEQLIQRVDALEATNNSQATELSDAKEKITELNTKLSAATSKANDFESKYVELSKKPAATSVKDKTIVELAAAEKPYNKMTPAEKVRYHRENAKNN